MKSNFTIKVPDGETGVKSGVLNIAGRYGKVALLVLLSIAYVAVCMGAANVARAAIIAMSPIVFFVGLYIAVSEEVDA